MIPSSIEAPFVRAGWTWELKFDGWRALAYAERGEVRLISRRGRDLTRRFRTLAAALAGIVDDVVLDGEICVLDERGHSNFDLLGTGAPETFVAFDALSRGGRLLVDEVLVERREALATIVPRDFDVLRRSPVLGEDGIGLWEWVQDVGHEGLVAKRAASLYRPGTTREWLKIKTEAGRAAQRDRGERFAR